MKKDFVSMFCLKKNTQMKIRRSKFFPPNILNEVYFLNHLGHLVYKYHQNIKLMTEAAKINATCKDLLKVFV